jgi:hypothetical protein
MTGVAADRGAEAGKLYRAATDAASVARVSRLSATDSMFPMFRVVQGAATLAFAVRITRESPFASYNRTKDENTFSREAACDLRPVRTRLLADTVCRTLRCPSRASLLLPPPRMTAAFMAALVAACFVAAWIVCGLAGGMDGMDGDMGGGTYHMGFCGVAGGMGGGMAHGTPCRATHAMSRATRPCPASSRASGSGVERLLRRARVVRASATDVGDPAAWRVGWVTRDHGSPTVWASSSAGCRWRCGPPTKGREGSQQSGPRGRLPRPSPRLSPRPSSPSP